jgi:transposase
MAGSAQKTDKLDAKKLARFYAKGLLTFIYIADKEDESVRDLLRSKRFLIDQQTMLKNHLNGLCRRIGIDYRQETKKKTRWTKHHITWLEARVKGLNEIAHQLNFSLLLNQLDQSHKKYILSYHAVDRVLEVGGVIRAPPTALNFYHKSRMC